MTLLTDNLPLALREVRTRPLFVMRLDVAPLQVVGQTPGGFKRIGVVPSGAFDGERLSGQVLDGGNDWQSVRADGTVTLDVRLSLRTDDGALITMAYKGLRHGPPAVIGRLDAGEDVDPVDYYFRISPLFETAAPAYDWLNGIMAIGVGQRLKTSAIYSLFEIL
jgi:hypothetical protein